MSAARYVGRVGGLAVALGVGSVIVIGGGVAYADTGSAGTTGVPHGTSSSVPAAGQNKAERAKKPKATKAPKAAKIPKAATTKPPKPGDADGGSRRPSAALTAVGPKSKAEVSAPVAEVSAPAAFYSS